MINILISLSLAIFSYEMFSLTAKISSLNKTMVNIPLSIFSYNVPLVNQDEFYFDKNMLEYSLDQYFASNITKYVNAYFVDYTYFNSDSTSICMSKYCQCIKISMNATIDGIYSYHRAMEYEIGVGNGQV